MRLREMDFSEIIVIFWIVTSYNYILFSWYVFTYAHDDHRLNYTGHCQA